MKRHFECSQNLSEDVKIKVEKELELGFLNLSEKFFEQAKMNFEVAKNIDKKCPDAFWGLMLVKVKAENEDFLYREPEKFRKVLKFRELKLAREFASENLRKKYDDLLQNIYLLEKN